MPDEPWRDEIQEYAHLLQAVASGDRSKVVKLLGDYLLRTPDASSEVEPPLDEQQQEEQQDSYEDGQANYDENYYEREDGQYYGQYGEYGENRGYGDYDNDGQQDVYANDHENDDATYPVAKQRRRVRFADEERTFPLENTELTGPENGYGYDRNGDDYHGENYDPDSYDGAYDSDLYMSGALADGDHQSDRFNHAYDQNYAQQAGDGYLDQASGYDDQSYGGYGQETYSGQYEPGYHGQHDGTSSLGSTGYYDANDTNYAYNDKGHNLEETGDDGNETALNGNEDGVDTDSCAFDGLGIEDHWNDPLDPADTNEIDQTDLGMGEQEEQVRQLNLDLDDLGDEVYFNNQDEDYGEQEAQAGAAHMHNGIGDSESGPTPGEDFDKTYESHLRWEDPTGQTDPDPIIATEELGAENDQDNLAYPPDSPSEYSVGSNEGSFNTKDDDNDSTSTLEDPKIPSSEAYAGLLDEFPPDSGGFESKWNLDELIPVTNHVQGEESWVPKDWNEDWRTEAWPEADDGYMTNNPLRHIYEAERADANPVRPYYDNAPLPFTRPQDIWGDSLDDGLNATPLYYDKDLQDEDYESTADSIDPHYNVFVGGSRFYTHFNDSTEDPRIRRHLSRRVNPKRTPHDPRSFFDRIRERLS
ncbi:hypothetical protein LTS15_007706 [Exophiala xenobiotica]|nr:hypothetical protein LTS15_007706 [Exophiala xenobiotica]